MLLCQKVTSSESKNYIGKQGLNYSEGISKQTVGSNNLCMMILMMVPGQRAIAHLHENHETAICMLEGEIETWWGENLEYHTVTKEGDYFYIPANVPHLPWNKSNMEAYAVISRTDPNEQESVTILHGLDERFKARMGIK